jgi:hypothetical protein
MSANLAPLKQWNFYQQFNTDVITRAASMFMNLKINKINEILIVLKLLNTNQLKSKQTYIKRSSFNVLYTCRGIDLAMKGHHLYILESC